MSRLGRLLSLLALALQLAAASIVLPDGIVRAASLEALAAASICHGTPAAPHKHHTPVPKACPLIQSIAQAGALLAAATPPLPPPAVMVALTAPLPPARAPPNCTVLAAFPRGPPTPV